MSSRSADATIKGYFYQFDHSILQILSSTSNSSKMVVEGVEDVDLTNEDRSRFIQCKYYSGSGYNHSVIKDAVIAMLRHFVRMGCPSTGSISYQLYGHYKSGQEKLPASFDIEFMKRNFLTFSTAGKGGLKTKHEVYAELGMSDDQLESFRKHLEIDLNAKSYEDQQKDVCALIKELIPGATAEETEAFYYPNAINVIQGLAVQRSEAKRAITKGSFIKAMNRKQVVFSLWLKEKFGLQHYARSLHKQHFDFGTKVPAACRIIVLEFDDGFDPKRVALMLEKISAKLSHKEHRSTSAAQRFCPYVLIRGISSADIMELKRVLWSRGLNLSDGYPFLGADFDIENLTRLPVPGNMTKLKFVSGDSQLTEIAKRHSGQPTDVFDFYMTTPVTVAASGSILHHEISVDSAYFASEVI